MRRLHLTSGTTGTRGKGSGSRGERGGAANERGGSVASARRRCSSRLRTWSSAQCATRPIVYCRRRCRTYDLEPATGDGRPRDQHVHRLAAAFIIPRMRRTMIKPTAVHISPHHAHRLLALLLRHLHLIVLVAGLASFELGPAPLEDAPWPPLPSGGPPAISRVSSPFSSRAAFSDVATSARGGESAGVGKPFARVSMETRPLIVPGISSRATGRTPGTSHEPSCRIHDFRGVEIHQTGRRR